MLFHYKIATQKNIHVINMEGELIEKTQADKTDFRILQGTKKYYAFLRIIIIPKPVVALHLYSGHTILDSHLFAKLGNQKVLKVTE